MQFTNREDAGKRLAKKLTAYKDKQDTIVLALPRGGVPVAFEIMKHLRVPLDIILVRKLGVPGHEELAMGAIANGDVQVLNEGIINSLNIPSSVVTRALETQRRELTRRSEVYRNGKSALNLKEKTIILVDDGMATGANMRAAISAVKQQQAAHIIVAIPVASDSAYDTIKELVDKIISLKVPDFFYGVGGFYKDFSQTTDTEVIELLEQAQYWANDNASVRHMHAS